MFIFRESTVNMKKKIIAYGELLRPFTEPSQEKGSNKSRDSMACW